MLFFSQIVSRIGFVVSDQKERQIGHHQIGRQILQVFAQIAIRVLLFDSSCSSSIG